jgi:dienelactone hydrolase
MIEIILLITAALSAGDVVGASDDAESTAAAQVVTVAAEARRGGEERVLALEEPARDADEWHRLDDQPLRRLAAGFAPEKDPDLVAPTKVGPDSAPAVQLARSEMRYTSQGNEVRMEVLRPDSDQRRPAILILHGASGIGDGSFYRAAAETFAERGYATFLPLYLAPGKAGGPGAKSAAKNPAKSSAKTSAKTAPKDPTPGGSVRAGFAVQERILVDALEQIAQNPYVDASRIGIFGMSLGGFHALNLSSRDPRIAAVVNMGGALRGNTMPDSNRLAPTLALHGAKDSVVPVSRARSLGRYLKEHGIPHDVVIYNDQGHFFRGKARQDAFERSAQFFSSYLTGPATSATARSKDGSDR